MSVDQMPVYKLYADQMSADQMAIDQVSVNQMAIKQHVCQSNGFCPNVC
jgi:hypothetical protein